MRLDLATRTLFTEFQESVFARTALSREIKGMSTFVHKRVKGGKYWYSQRFVQGRYEQHYFGPSNPKNDAHVASFKREYSEKKELLKELAEKEARQAAMLKRGGIPAIDKRVASVLTRLSEAGLIDGKGTLIGTIAFTAYSGLLGAMFEKIATRTNDIDIVQGADIKITTTDVVDMKDLLAATGLGFRGVPGLVHGYPSTSFISKDGIRIDLLTPLRGRPKRISQIRGIKGAAAIPLPFIDLLIESPIRTILIGPSGGIPVQVPEPSRFAIHKLIVAMRRPVTESAKKRKDIIQAEQLIRVLAEEEPKEFARLWKKTCQGSKKLSKLLSESRKLLSRDIDDIIEGLAG